MSVCLDCLNAPAKICDLHLKTSNHDRADDLEIEALKEERDALIAALLTATTCPTICLKCRNRGLAALTGEVRGVRPEVEHG